MVVHVITVIAWDQAPYWGKKRKKIASEARREVIWGGERVLP